MPREYNMTLDRELDDDEVEAEVNPGLNVDPGAYLDVGNLEGLSADQILIRRKILWTLLTYPKISPSMMQAALGPNRPARDWRPVLENLLREGAVCSDQKSFISETGRYRIAIVLSLQEFIRAELEVSELQHLGV